MGLNEKGCKAVAKTLKELEALLEIHIMKKEYSCLTLILENLYLQGRLDKLEELASKLEELKSK